MTLSVCQQIKKNVLCIHNGILLKHKEGGNIVCGKIGATVAFLHNKLSQIHVFLLLVDPRHTAKGFIPSSWSEILKVTEL